MRMAIKPITMDFDKVYFLPEFDQLEIYPHVNWNEKWNFPWRKRKKSSRTARQTSASIQFDYSTIRSSSSMFYRCRANSKKEETKQSYEKIIDRANQLTKPVKSTNDVDLAGSSFWNWSKNEKIDERNEKPIDRSMKTFC